MPHSPACGGEVIILRNVIQVIFILFNHVERIWHRPRLSLSLPVCKTQRLWGGGLKRNGPKEEGRHTVEWRNGKQVGIVSSSLCQTVLRFITFYCVKNVDIIGNLWHHIPPPTCAVVTVWE